MNIPQTRRMKRRLLVLALCLLAGVTAWLVWRSRRVPAPLPPPVDLTQHDSQTIDFSSGRPVVKDSAADKAAMDAALKDIAAATKDVKFEAEQKKEAPPAKPAATKP